MISIGTEIEGYKLIAMANGYVIGHSSTAPSPYAVWQIDDDGKGVCCGHYFTDHEEAEWDFCARAFEWFEDNVNIHMIEDDEGDLCEMCRYNTHDFVCHPHCGGCDGKSKFVSQKTPADVFLDNVRKIRTNMENAVQLVDEMCVEMDRLKAERSGTNGNNKY